MHSRKRGKSGSKHPLKKESPSWLQYSKDEIVELILQSAKEGKPASVIGLILRDQYGIPSVKSALGKGITDILKEKEMAAEYPEDLMNLMKKAVRLRKHLDANRRDTHNRRALSLIESKMRRLAAYYRASGVLPKDWYYKPEQVALIVKG